MGKLGYIVLGLALLVGSLAFAGYRHLSSVSGVATRQTAPVASRNVPPPPAARPSAGGGASSPNTSVSGLQLFEMGLNVANVVVGILGIWMTMRGMRAERRANEMALRRDR